MMSVDRSPSPLVYILILNYCSYCDTKKCIEYARKLDYINYRILVLDNDSPDTSGSKLKEILPPEEFIQLKNNYGYAGGNNHGIAFALKHGADFVFIVNPDVRLSPSSVSDYIEVFNAHDNVGAVGPIQLTEGKGSFDVKFEIGAFQRYGVSVPSIPLTRGQVWDVDVLYGAALFIPKEILLKVGGFDPLFFAYGEEEDYCRRIKKLGKRLLITSNSPVEHLRTKEKESLSDAILFLRLKGILLFQLKSSEQSFFRRLGMTIGTLGKQLVTQSKAYYPYNMYPVKRVHTFKTILWFILYFPRIWRHISLEEKCISNLYINYND